MAHQSVTMTSPADHPQPLSPNPSLKKREKGNEGLHQKPPPLSLVEQRLPLLLLTLLAIGGILIGEYLPLTTTSFFVVTLFLGGGFFLILGLLQLLEKHQRKNFLYSFSHSCFFLEKILPFFFSLFFMAAFATEHAWQWRDSPDRQLANYLLAHPENNITFRGVVMYGQYQKKSPTQKPLALTQKEKEEAQHLSGPGTPHRQALQTSQASPMQPLLIAIKQLEIASKKFPLETRMIVLWEGSAPQIGDMVCFRAEILPQKHPTLPGSVDYAQWHAREGIWTELAIDPSDPGKVIGKTNHYFLERWAQKSRLWLQKKLAAGLQKSSNALRVIEGITLGIKPQLSSEQQNIRTAFEQTGTMHLFAVSGLHVGMISLIIWMLLHLLRLPKGIAIFIAIALIFFYVLLTGLHIGSIRAATMASILLIGALYYRGTPPINSLGAASLLLLASNTNLLFLPSWQLSFSVVMAILIITPPLQYYLSTLLEKKLAPDPFLPEELHSPWLKKCQQICSFLAGSIALCFAAWAGSLLPSLYYFHQISLSGLCINMVAIPLAFLIMATGATSLILGLFYGPLGVLCNNSNWLLAKILLLVIHLGTLIPGGSWNIHTLLSPPHPQLILIPSRSITPSHGPITALLERSGQHYLLNTGSAYTVDHTILPLLHYYGITRLTAVFLTQKKSCSMGGLLRLSEAVTINCIYTPKGKSHSSVWRKTKTELIHKPKITWRKLSQRQLAHIRNSSQQLPKESPLVFALDDIIAQKP